MPHGRWRQCDCKITVNRYSLRGVLQGCVPGLVLFLVCVKGALAGSRLIEPPARQSLWRYGFGTPQNFYDDDVNCGGYSVQHDLNGGLCGVCGDPWNNPVPRDHEAGGKIAPNPLPVRAYKKGGFIQVALDSTADLLGKYEFRLCKLNASMDTPDQACFDQTRLPIREAEFGQSYQIGQSGGLVSLHLQLPENLVCNHCILQWRHITGYRTNRQDCVQCGTEPPKCTFCKGCGPQEWYQGCVDISVYDTVGTHPALAGVHTQQELKEKWEATLASYTNCSCSNQNSVSSGSSVTPSDNTINGFYPFPESTSPNFAVTTPPVVTASASNGNLAQTALPTVATVPNSATGNQNQGQTGKGDNDQNTVHAGTNTGTHSTTHARTTTARPGVVTDPKTPGNNPKPDGHHPIFNNQWTSNHTRPQQTVCYIPHRPPSYLYNAHTWCAQNCPQRRVYCNYNVCRPVACDQINQNRWNSQRNLAWLLPFLLTEGLELR